MRSRSGKSEQDRIDVGVSRAPSDNAPGASKVLHGTSGSSAVRFMWHEFQSNHEVDWSKSFHPKSVELCLNLGGEGIVRDGDGQARYSAASAGFYAVGEEKLDAKRTRDQNHQFLTISYGQEFLIRYLGGKESMLHPILRSITEDRGTSGISAVGSLTSSHRTLVSGLRNPPILSAAQSLWYEAKAIELMAEFFVQPPAEQEFFCTRQRRLAKERVDQVIGILRRSLVEPPSLEEIGREVGCSPFYLSRTFSQELGVGIPQYLRQLRMEKASELLKSRKYNVTEVALEVGYSSLSHFSQAFHQTFGCCPGLYPLKTVRYPVSRSR